MHLATNIAAFGIVVCSGLGFAAGQGSSTFRFAFTEKPGQYGVGLKVVEQYDHSRTFQLEGGSSEKSAGPGSLRPLQTLAREAKAETNWRLRDDLETSVANLMESFDPAQAAAFFCKTDSVRYDAFSGRRRRALERE